MLTSRSIAYALFGGLLGVVLLVAAILKAASPALASSSLLPAAPSSVSYWFAMGLASAESVLGLWLISGLVPRRARWTAFGTFLVMGLFSLWRLVRGQPSCGCFGPVRINPGWTLAFDVFAGVGLILFRPPPAGPPEHMPGTSSGRARMWHGAVIAVTAISCLCVVSFVVWRFLALRGEVEGTTLFVGSVAILEPDKWRGQPLPIGSHIDVGGRIQTGRWILVLHRMGCPECQHLLADCRLVAALDATSTDAPRFAFVEIPPLQETADRALEEEEERYLIGHLTPDYDWFVQTPMVALVDEGRVVAAGRQEVVNLSRACRQILAACLRQTNAVQDNQNDESASAGALEGLFVDSRTAVRWYRDESAPFRLTEGER